MSIIPFLPSHRPGATHNPTAISIARFGYGTNVFPLRVPPRERLYSTKTFKSLGTLDYHKDMIQAITFARNAPPHLILPKTRVERAESGLASASVGEGDVDDYDEGEFSSSEFGARKRWLVTGGKDGQISVWELVDFTNPKPFGQDTNKTGFNRVMAAEMVADC